MTPWMITNKIHWGCTYPSAKSALKVPVSKDERKPFLCLKIAPLKATVGTVAHP
jgi:hypothetical protein